MSVLSVQLGQGSIFKNEFPIGQTVPQIMSLPGLGLSAPPEAELRPPAIHLLKEGTEWRFEVAFGSNVEVKVLNSDPKLS